MGLTLRQYLRNCIEDKETLLRGDFDEVTFDTIEDMLRDRNMPDDFWRVSTHIFFTVEMSDHGSEAAIEQTKKILNSYLYALGIQDTPEMGQ